MIDVDKEHVHPERRVSPPQRRGERERVSAAGEPNDDPIVNRELGVARTGKQALLEPSRRLAADTRA